jgi:hypothetical protein
MKYNIVNLAQGYIQLLDQEKNSALSFKDFNIKESIFVWNKIVANSNSIQKDLDNQLLETTDFVDAHFGRISLLATSIETILKNMIPKLNILGEENINKNIDIYIDVNCGAGWATIKNKDTYAILLGIKTIIELGWDKDEIIKK